MIWVALVVSAIAGLAAWAMYLKVRWPWVSRLAYEDMVAIASSEREQVRKLTRIITRLKISRDAQLPTKVEAKKERQSDLIEQAITRSRHANNPAIRTALRNFADGESAKGTDLDVILERLAQWDRVGDDLRDEEEDDDSLLS